MTTPTPEHGLSPRLVRPGPPTKHQLALMIWVAVFPTLTVLNPALGDRLHTLNPSCAPSSWPPLPCPSSSTD